MTRPWWTSRRRTFAWLWLQMACCVGAFGFVYWFTVQTITGRQLADAALRGAKLTRAAASVEATLDVVSATALIAAVAAIAVVALIRMRRASGLVAIGVGTTNLRLLSHPRIVAAPHGWATCEGLAGSGGRGPITGGHAPPDSAPRRRRQQP